MPIANLLKVTLRAVLPIGFLGALLALGACGSNTQETGQLVIYSGRSESLVAPLITQFEQQTGIAVEVKYAKSGVLAATLLEEGENSPADLFYAQDPASIGAVNELLKPLSSELTNSVPAWARSADDRWIGISGRLRTLVYNPDLVSQLELPSGIEDYTDPKWRGRIGWAPTNGSFQAMVAAMRVVWGDQRTTDWVAGVVANEPTVYHNNTSTVQGVANGEVAVGFVNHYYALRLANEFGPGFKALNSYFESGDVGGMALVTTAGILETANNPVEAQRFVEFLLSDATQSHFTESTFEVPLLSQLTVSAAIPVDVINGALVVNPTDLTDLEGVQNLLRSAGALE